MTQSEMVKKILNKRKPTGTDLGRLALLVGISHNQAVRNGVDFQYPFEQQDLEARLSKLDEEQFFIYYGFIGLYNIVQSYRSDGQANYQQAVRCYYHMMLILNKPYMLAPIKVISDDCFSENVKNEVRLFKKSIEVASAIDQFYKDVEEIYNFPELYSTFQVFGNLKGYINAYNDVMRYIKEEKKSEYDEIVLGLPYITEEDYLPKTPVKAKNAIRNIDVFKGEVFSTKFYNLYRGIVINDK